MFRYRVLVEMGFDDLQVSRKWFPHPWEAELYLTADFQRSGFVQRFKDGKLSGMYWVN